uniref:Transcriptional regulator, TetR family n=1 Tax=Psychrobacter sp. (strain PRwf-1) TaxID=349106 RepID=A5WFH0_PSYWF
MAKKPKAKDVLIDTASHLFMVRGYCGVGLNDIIDESGIPKGSLYYYFPEGKEQLAIAAIEHTKQLVLEDITRVFSENSNLIEALQAYVFALAQMFGEGGKPIGSPIGTIAGEKHSTSEPIRLACESTFKGWQAVYAEKFVASGYSQEQADSLATVFHALTEGGILLAFTTKNGKPLEAIAEQIPSLFSEKPV